MSGLLAADAMFPQIDSEQKNQGVFFNLKKQIL